MAVVYVTGGEVGLSVTAGGGLALSSPSPANSSLSQIRVKSGSYAYRVNHVASAIGVRAFVNVAASTANGGFWLYLETLPSADAKLFTIQGATNEDMVIQFDQGTSKLAGLDPVNGQIGIYTSCPVLSADTWYWIAWKSDRSANQLSITITPDGGSATDCGALTNAVGWTANNGWVAIGNDSADVAVDFYIDDIIVCSGTAEYPLAPHEVLLLQPGADGSHNVAGTEYIASSTGTTPNFTNSSTTVWQELDDLPWSTTLKTSGGVWCEVHSAGTYLEIAPATAASGKPDATAVRTILGYGSASTTANNGSAAVIRDSAAAETTIRGNFTTGADYSESSTFFNGVMVPAPAGGWTKTEIEALRWRIGRASNSSDISPRPSWQVLGLEIAYEITAGGNTYEKTGGGVLVASDSGADVSAFTEAGTGTSPRVGSGLDAFFPTERGTGILSMSGGGVAAKAGITFTKAGSGIVGMAASGADACTFSESGAGVSARAGSGSDATTFTESGAGISARVGSGAKSVVYTKRGSGVLNASASGSKSLAGGATYVKAGAGISAFSGSGSKAVNFSEAGSGVLNFSGSGSETKTAGATYSKAGSGVMVLTASGAKARVLTKTGSGVLIRSGSGAKAVVYGESGSGQAVFFGAGGRQIIHERTGAGILAMLASGFTDTAPPVTFHFGPPSPIGAKRMSSMLEAAEFGQPSLGLPVFGQPSPGQEST